MRNPSWFTVFAVLLLFFLVAELFIIYRVVPARLGPLTWQGKAQALMFSILSIVVAVGLFQRRKWAALIFSVATFSWAMVLIIGSILNVPLPWMLLNLVFGIGFMFPTLVTIRCWPMLVWGRRR